MKKAEASDPTLVFLRTELSSNKTLPPSRSKKQPDDQEKRLRGSEGKKFYKKPVEW